MIFKIISAVKIRVKTWREEKEIQEKVTENTPRYGRDSTVTLIST